MNNKLLKKLQIKPGHTVCVCNPPVDFDEIIGEVPAEITIAKDTPSFNALLIFAVTKADMVAAIEAKRAQLLEQTICWIIYPKTRSKIASDLNLMQSWEELKTHQLAPCASAAINEVWTAIRIKPEAASRRSGLGNAEIRNNEYGEFIDVTNKIVTLPPDIVVVLQPYPEAKLFLDQLSYTNRKEYVLWILSAKQEKTKASRLEKMVNLLLSNKKNPSS